jgi:sugar phosphate isomerase/epimerase
MSAAASGAAIFASENATADTPKNEAANDRHSDKKAQGNERRWRMAFGLNGFESSEVSFGNSFPIWEVLEFAQREGFEGIEIVPNWPHKNMYVDPNDDAKINSLRELFARYHLKIFSIQTSGQESFQASEAVRREWIKRFATLAAFARKVGCDCIGFWPGGDPGGQNIDQAIASLVGSLREMGKIMADNNMLLGVEIEPPFFFNKEEHLVRLLDGADHPNVKAIYDPSHFDLMTGSRGKPHEMLARVGVDRIAYMQFTDSDGTLFHTTSKHLPCGDGHIDIRASLDMLWKGGFNGWFMIDAWDTKDPYDACRKGMVAVQAMTGLPKTIHGWTRSEEPKRILADDIFQYMDGAGELYLGYRFKHLDVYEYASPGERTIQVELYSMESPDDAFGLLSGDWGGDPVDFGRPSARGDVASSWPGHRALYGSGLLRLWADNVYARVMAVQETPSSKAAVMAIGQMIVANRDNPPPPRLLSALPKTCGEGFVLRSDRVCYLRSHLVLNSVYFLSTGNILDLDNSVEAVTALYSLPDRKDRNSVRLLLIRYGNASAATSAIAHFEKVYLPEKHLTPANAVPGSRQVWKVEDGWLGYVGHGRDVALVFQCPNRESAVRFLDDAFNKVDKSEVPYEKNARFSADKTRLRS